MRSGSEVYLRFLHRFCAFVRLRDPTRGSSPTDPVSVSVFASGRSSTPYSVRERKLSGPCKHTVGIWPFYGVPNPVTTRRKVFIMTWRESRDLSQPRAQSLQGCSSKRLNSASYGHPCGFPGSQNRPNQDAGSDPVICGTINLMGPNYVPVRQG